MQMVNDKDKIWDLISKEDRFKDSSPGQLMNRDIFHMDKAALKQDQEFLNKIISFSSTDKMQVIFQDTNDII